MAHDEVRRATLFPQRPCPTARVGMPVTGRPASHPGAIGLVNRGGAYELHRRSVRPGRGHPGFVPGLTGMAALFGWGHDV